MPWWTREIEQAQARHRARVAALYDGRATDGPVAIEGRMAGRNHGLWGTNEIDMLREPDAWLADALADIREHAAEAADPRTFRPMVIELDAFGTHYIDALFGARVGFVEGQVWSDQLACDLEDLAEPLLDENEVFHASLRLARRAVELTEGRFFISNPVLSCPANIGINLFGERLLEALAVRPEAARRALRIVTNVIKRCMAAFAEAIPFDQRVNTVGCNRYAPPGFGFIDGCATQLVSAEHYAGFFAPVDAELLAFHPRGGMIHLCGAHEQHIPAWRAMQALRSVQLNDRAADDFEAYFRGLREDQIVYIGPTAAMPLARILDISAARRVVLQCALPG